jgi:hypothetical protein
MTTTRVWHPNRAIDRPVYHDNTRCLEGSAIEASDRRPGDGGCVPCEHCMELLVQTIEAIWGLGASTTDRRVSGPLSGERPTSAGPATA